MNVDEQVTQAVRFALAQVSLRLAEARELDERQRFEVYRMAAQVLRGQADVLEEVTK